MENKMIKHFKQRMVYAAVAGLTAMAVTTASAADLTLRGASLFDNEHAYSKTLIKFAELVNEQSADEITFDLRGNSELGIEPD